MILNIWATDFSANGLLHLSFDTSGVDMGTATNGWVLVHSVEIPEPSQSYVDSICKLFENRGILKEADSLADSFEGENREG